MLAGGGTGRLSPPAGMTTATNTVITAPGSINTKGAWTQLSSSLPFDVCGILVNYQDSGGSVDGWLLFDIGIGSSGNEWPVIENVFNMNMDVSTSGSIGNFGAKFFPVNLRAGARLSARQQVNTLSGKVANLSVSLFGVPPGGLQGGSRIIAIGADTANSRGTVVGPASSTAWGSWVELTASCPAQIVAIMPYCFNVQAVTVANVRSALDIALGASGSEFPLVERLVSVADKSNNKCTGGVNMAPSAWLPCNIPAGARVSARMKHSVSEANTANDVILYGLVA